MFHISSCCRLSAKAFLNNNNNNKLVLIIVNLTFYRVEKKIVAFVGALLYYIKLMQYYKRNMRKVHHSLKYFCIYIQTELLSLHL